MALYKKLLRQIAVETAPNGHQGFTIAYDPEITPKLAGTYIPYLPATNTTWENTNHCTKEEIDQIQHFIDILEKEGALQLVKQKKNENGAYNAYYEMTDKYESIYHRLDPNGLLKAKEILKKNRKVA